MVRQNCLRPNTPPYKLSSCIAVCRSPRSENQRRREDCCPLRSIGDVSTRPVVTNGRGTSPARLISKLVSSGFGVSKKNRIVQAEVSRVEDRLIVAAIWLAVVMAVTWVVWALYLFWPTRALSWAG